MRSARFVVAMVVLVVCAACSRKDVAEKTFYPMGGIPFSIKAYNVPSALFEETVAAIEAETGRLEELLSMHRPEGQLARINQEGSGEASPELLRLLHLSARISAESEGAFDVSVAPLVGLWKHCAQENRRPEADELEQVRSLVDWRQVTTSTRGTVSFRNKGMAIDLGGVAKGFIADSAVRMLLKQGIKRGIVDAGGDLVLFNSVGEDPFRIGIKDPRTPERIFAILELDSGAVVTSGCYERFHDIQGRRYCHIIDPRNGEPVSELASATVVAEEAATADALATAVMVLGVERGQAVINSLPGVEGVLIWDGKQGLEWWISAGLQGKVRIEPGVTD